jgi:hypothetical protein
MRRAALAIVVLVALLATGVPAWAHTRAPQHPVSAFVPTGELLIPAAPEPALPLAGLALLAAVGLAALSRQRRIVALTLVAIVALLTFETGVHSTHHIGTGEDSAHCAIAWMSAQLSADIVDGTIHAAPTLAPRIETPLLASQVLVERSIAPVAGRAPPVLSV